MLKMLKVQGISRIRITAYGKQKGRISVGWRKRTKMGKARGEGPRGLLQESMWQMTVPE